MEIENLCFDADRAPQRFYRESRAPVRYLEFFGQFDS